MKPILAAFILVYLLGGVAMPVWARDIFVDVEATVGGNGSQTAAFQSVKAAMAKSGITGGDRIILRAGNYGDMKISGARFSATVHIIAARDETVQFQSLTVNNSENLRFSGFEIWPDNPKPSDSSLVQTSGNSSSITFENLDIRSHRDARNYRSWSLAMWQSVKRRGVLLRGVRNTIQNSQITGTFIGISASGDHALIAGNRVSGFSGDALRALGDFSLVTGNYAQDCIKIDRNHDDGFQSWSRGPNGKAGKGVVRGLTIENNIILEWNGQAPHPLRCSLQGIGLFDGMFENLTIQNNLVSVSAYHGISVAGGLNSKIVNNTVINATGASDRQPWIAVSAHKNGTPPRNVTVANNAAMAFRLSPKTTQTAAGNYTINNPVNVLNDPFGNDFRPRAGSALVGRGFRGLGPKTDILGVSRPPNGRPDIGAFQSR